MGKTLSALILIGFLAVLVMPQAVLAQSKPADCCQIGKTLEINDVTYNKGIYVGEKNGCKEHIAAGLASECTETANAENAASCATEKWGLLCLLSTLGNIADWIFVVLVALSGIFIIIGAFTLLTSAGDPTKVASGRNYIMYAAIGLVVGFLARAIPSLVGVIAGF